MQPIDPMVWRCLELRDNGKNILCGIGVDS